MKHLPQPTKDNSNKSMDTPAVSKITPTQFTARLTEFGLKSFGCTEEEIEHIEDRFGVRLPAAYKEFLSLMGKKCANFACCESWEYYSLSWVRQAALKLLKQDESEDFYEFERARAIAVPRNTFFFLAEIACYCLFFNCDDGDDPPVYLIEDGDTEYRQVFESFSDFFSAFANQALKHLSNDDDEEPELDDDTESEDESAPESDDDAEDEDDDSTFRRVFKAQEVRVTDVASRSLKYALKEYGVIPEGELVGCSEDEVNRLEDDLYLSLPLAYRCFLEALGKASPGYLDDCAWHLDALLENQRRAKTILIENNCAVALKETDFVFLVREPDLFLFFDTAERDVDPPVFRYRVGDAEPRIANPSFTDWIQTFRSTGYGMEFALEYEAEEPYFPMVEVLTKSPGSMRSIDLSKMVARSKRKEVRAQLGHTRTKLRVELDKYGFDAIFVGDDNEGLSLHFRWSSDTRVDLQGEFLTITFPLVGFEFQFSVPRVHLAEWQGQWIREITNLARRTEPPMRAILFGQFKYSWNPSLPAPIHSGDASSGEPPHAEAEEASLPAIDAAVDFNEHGIESQISIADELKISYFFRNRWKWQLHQSATAATLYSPEMDAGILLSDGALTQEQTEVIKALTNYSTTP